MAEIRYYLDENLPVVIAEQLHRRGIEALTARRLGALGETDEQHLQRATQMRCVLCTCDTDFVMLARNGMEPTDIIIGQPEKHRIGELVNGLTLCHTVHTAEEMLNRVEYL